MKILNQLTAMNKQYIVVILFAAILFGGGFFTGYSFKQCPVVQTEQTTVDTSYADITGGGGSPVEQISEPTIINKVKANGAKILQAGKRPNDDKQRNIAPEDKLQSQTTSENCKDTSSNINAFDVDCFSSFSAVDTARHDSAWLAINYDIDCINARVKANYTWGGKAKVITINNTKNIATPPPLFALYGGVCNQFISSPWQLQDFGPAAALVYKQKHEAMYQYLAKSQTHNFTLLTKIR